MSVTFPQIKTDRLLLRQLNLNDIDDLFELRYHDDVIKFIARKKTNNKNSIKQFIIDRNEDVAIGKIMFWAIQQKGESKLIGTISLWSFNETKTIAEVGYELQPDCHNKGFMSEALEAVLEFGYAKLKIEAIEAFTDKNNTNSQLLLEKFNFKYEANRTDEGFPNNRIYIKNKKT